MKSFLVFMAVLFAAGTVMAETYRWVDDRGTINFTEDYAQIPKKYRKKARVIGSVEARHPKTSARDDVELKKDKARKDSSRDQEAGIPEKQAKTIPSYGGKSAEKWQAEFKKLHADMDDVQGRLDERQARLANPGDLSRARYLGIQDEIKELDARLANLRNNLNALNDEATRAGVPSALR